MKISLKEMYDQLTPLLEKYGHLPVIMEGCDCDGLVGAVIVFESGCYLARSNQDVVYNGTTLNT